MIYVKTFLIAICMFNHYFNTYEAVTPPPQSKNAEIRLEVDSLTDQDNDVLNFLGVFPWSYRGLTDDPSNEQEPEFDELASPTPNNTVSDTEEWTPSWVKKDKENQKSANGQELSNLVIDNIIATGRSCIGLPYKSGGATPKAGMDCSGFLYYIFNSNGIKIDRSTYAFQTMGKEVSLSEARPGDIIVTPGKGKSGLHVKMISRIDSDGKIYTLEAKGLNYGIDEFELKNTDNIKTIRRVINNDSLTANPSTQSKSTSTGVKGKFSDEGAFARELNAGFRKALAAKGLDPDYSYTLTAQASMESGWGTAVPANYNFSGISVPDKKAESNPGIARRAWAKKWSKDKGIYYGWQYFRNFDSIEDYCTYKVNLLSNDRYNVFNQYGPNDTYSFIYHLLKQGYGSDKGGPRSVKYAKDATTNSDKIKQLVRS